MNIILKKTKKTYSIELDDSNLAVQSAKKSAHNNVSIKVPDIISNASAKSKNYSKLENLDDSDDEIDTRRQNNFTSNVTSNQSHSIQMQHEVLV